MSKVKKSCSFEIDFFSKKSRKNLCIIIFTVILREKYIQVSTFHQQLKQVCKFQQKNLHFFSELIHSNEEKRFSCLRMCIQLMELHKNHLQVTPTWTHVSHSVLNTNFTGKHTHIHTAQRAHTDTTF